MHAGRIDKDTGGTNPKLIHNPSAAVHRSGRDDAHPLHKPLMTGIRRHLIPPRNHQSRKRGMKSISWDDAAFHKYPSLLFSNLVGDILSY